MNDEILEETGKAIKAEHHSTNISIRRVANGLIISDGCDEYIAKDKWELREIIERLTVDLEY